MAPAVLLPSPRLLRGRYRRPYDLVPSAPADPGAVAAALDAYAGELSARGVEVLCLDDPAALPFPPAAGIVGRREHPLPITAKTFYQGTAAAGTEPYGQLLGALGFRVEKLPALRFLGDADHFALGAPELETYLYAFSPEAGGLGSDERLYTPVLRSVAHGRATLTQQLLDARFPRGDLAFLVVRDHLFVSPGAVDDDGLDELVAYLGERVHALRDEDAVRGAANALYLETARGRFLFAPEDLSVSLRRAIEALEVEVVNVATSAMLTEMRGCKCFALRLGPLDGADPVARAAHRYRS